MSNKFYVTTAIPYVNARPHIGFAMEIIQADCLARYHKLRGDEVFFLTGTDEHGSKLYETAKEKGMTAQELADENAEHYKDLKDKLNTKYDGFVRTTDEAHKKGAQKMWKKLSEAGDIYKDTYEGLYCVGCEAYILEKELVEGKCPHHNKEPEKLEEENYFFKLSKYSDQIKQAIETDELRIVPESRKHEILNVLKDGLKDVSFSRPKSNLPWGVDVPDDPDQVMYVWCDALSNYITAIGYEEETDQFKRFWPADVHVIGKDILRFHAAIWIGMLIASGLAIPKSILVHGFITSEGKKMSKTLGNVVDPDDYASKYGIDAVRYYLLKEIPTTDDGDFSKERFRSVYESDLANNVGNLVSRVIAMTGKYFDSRVPESEKNNNLIKTRVDEEWKHYEGALKELDMKRALEGVASLADFANKYVEDTKPWVLAKEDPDRLKDVMYDLLEIIRHLGLMLTPYIPEAAGKILAYLGMSDDKRDYGKLKEWGGMECSASINKAEPLFMRVEEA